MFTLKFDGRVPAPIALLAGLVIVSLVLVGVSYFVQFLVYTFQFIRKSIIEREYEVVPLVPPPKNLFLATAYGREF